MQDPSRRRRPHGAILGKPGRKPLPSNTGREASVGDGHAQVAQPPGVGGAERGTPRDPFRWRRHESGRPLTESECAGEAGLRGHDARGKHERYRQRAAVRDQTHRQVDDLAAESS